VHRSPRRHLAAEPGQRGIDAASRITTRCGARSTGRGCLSPLVRRSCANEERGGKRFSLETAPASMFDSDAASALPSSTLMEYPRSRLETVSEAGTPPTRSRDRERASTGRGAPLERGHGGQSSFGAQPGVKYRESAGLPAPRSICFSRVSVPHNPLYEEERPSRVRRRPTQTRDQSHLWPVSRPPGHEMCKQNKQWGFPSCLL
jgi:hypothetical protein